MGEVASVAVGGGVGRGEWERRGLSCRAGWMFAKLPGCRPRSKVVKAVGDGVGIGVGGFVGGHGEKLWVEFSRGCRWSSEEDQLPRVVSSCYFCYSYTCCRGGGKEVWKKVLQIGMGGEGCAEVVWEVTVVG